MRCAAQRARAVLQQGVHASAARGAVLGKARSAGGAARTGSVLQMQEVTTTSRTLGAVIEVAAQATEEVVSPVLSRCAVTVA